MNMMIEKILSTLVAKRCKLPWTNFLSRSSLFSLGSKIVSASMELRSRSTWYISWGKRYFFNVQANMLLFFSSSKVSFSHVTAYWSNRWNWCLAPIRSLSRVVRVSFSYRPNIYHSSRDALFGKKRTNHCWLLRHVRWQKVQFGMTNVPK